MDSDQIARLAYLALLGLAVGGWFIAEARGNLGKLTRQIVVWGLIFVGVIAAYGLWSDIRQNVSPRQSLVGAQTIQVPRGFDGHYYLTLELNGVDVEFVVDTGASDVVLSLQDARRIGIDPKTLNFSGQASTANGVVSTARTTVRTARLGDIVDKNLRVSVNGGEMQGSLLGMSYLRRFARIEIKDNLMLLKR